MRNAMLALRAGLVAVAICASMGVFAAGSAHTQIVPEPQPNRAARAAQLVAAESIGIIGGRSCYEAIADLWGRSSGLGSAATR